jgi:Catalase/Catalase-related immune-responsive
VLNRNPENYFAEVEQAAFNPAHFVPGIGPSPDKMLQGRLFSYGDTHRYRLGANHMHLPINRPHVAEVRNYSRDGSMRVDGNHGREKNYEPNSFGGPEQTGQQLWAPIEVAGLTGSHAPVHRPEDNDFVQAGNLYRLMKETAKEKSIANIAASLSKGKPRRNHRTFDRTFPQGRSGIWQSSCQSGGKAAGVALGDAAGTIQSILSSSAKSAPMKPRTPLKRLWPGRDARTHIALRASLIGAPSWWRAGCFGGNGKPSADRPAP